MTMSMSDRQVVDFKAASAASDPALQPAVTASPDHPDLALRARISSTVKAARAQRELEIQQAADRAAAERRAIQRKATAALLALLSDDVLDAIIGKHAGLGELPLGTIKVTKHGIELIQGGSAGASQMSGEKFDFKFDGAIVTSGQQLKSPEFQARVQDLKVQGLEIDGVYDPSGQAILITFDYRKILS
jgi:hypothetical protein